MSAWRHVYRWDLDKTYLDTHFESLRRLARIAFERPEQKVNVPGSAALLRELASDRPGRPPARVEIVSGSPRQMRRTIEKKLELDGVRWHALHLKPQWENLKRGRLRALRNQVGYKLPLLLESRAAVGCGVGETLFGDDAEADALVYSLYADLVAGRVDRGEMVRVLREAGAYDDAIDACVEHVRAIECDAVDDVGVIFIHLDQRTPPEFFAPFGPRVVPVFNYFQAALVLFAHGHMDAQGVVRVTRAFLAADQRTPDELANLFQDMVRRGFLAGAAMDSLGSQLRDDDDEGEAEVIRKCMLRFADLGEARAFRPPAPPAELDYSALLRHVERRSSRG